MYGFQRFAEGKRDNGAGVFKDCTVLTEIDKSLGLDPPLPALKSPNPH